MNDISTAQVVCIAMRHSPASSLLHKYTNVQPRCRPLVCYRGVRACVRACVRVRVQLE